MYVVSDQRVPSVASGTGFSSCMRSAHEVSMALRWWRALRRFSGMGSCQVLVGRVFCGRGVRCGSERAMVSWM